MKDSITITITGQPADWTSLRAFLARPIRLDACNYQGAPDAYRADRRTIVRDRADARSLIELAEAWGLSAASAAQGRLSFGSGGWHYVPGQYYPTEVCRAICAAVSLQISLTYPVRARLIGEGARGAVAWHVWTHDGRPVTLSRSGRKLRRWFA